MEINNTIRLVDGRRGKILATPSGFLSNGSYEIEVDGERKWVEEDQILYVIDTEFEDDINNYFEVIYDENGIHMIPKKLKEITIFDDNDELKSVELVIEGEKHEKVTFHIGDTNIWTSENPKPEEEEEIKDESKKHRII
jgi:hypothetical protein